MKEILSDPECKARLEDRQNQFAALLRAEPEKLRHLQFCRNCGGVDYQWTDWSTTELEPEMLHGLDVESGEDAVAYRTYLAKSMCETCDGTGFEAGSFTLTNDEWLNLAV